MHRGFSLTTSLIAALVLLLAINIISSILLRNAKLDLTEENLYTLSKGSRELLASLENDVKIKLFYSKQAASNVPQLKQYADRITELLRQYEAAGKGRIALEQLEPRPDTEVEEWALKYGLRPVNAMGMESIYLGLVVVNVDSGGDEAIPYLSPDRENFLEYDITRLINSINTTGKQKLGIMSALPVMGGDNDPMARFSGQPPQPAWYLVTELGKQFDVVTVEMTAEQIDPSINLLLVIHPKEIKDAALYAIDQFILRGGRAIIMADPLSFHEMMNFNAPDFQQRMQAQFNSNPAKLFTAWGIEMPDKIAADLDLATQVNMGSQVAKHPAFISVSGAQCNQEEIISANLETMIFVNSGHLVFDASAPKEGLTITPLITTSKNAGEADSFTQKLGGDPDTLRRDLKIGDKPLVLAAKVSGKFQTAFPEGKPAAEAKEGEAPPPAEPAANHLTASQRETTVIVVADSDVIADTFAVRIQNFFGQRIATVGNDNLAFLSNSAENLTGSQALISLRTRGKSDRPFTRVDRLESQAQERWREREAELVKKQEETEQRLRELERGKADEDARAVLTAQQMEEVRKFREQLAANSKELRTVRRNLRQDIEALGTRIKFINIALMPVLVLAAGFLPGLWNARRMRKKAAA